MSKKPNARTAAQQKAETAMPEVKRLVKKYGRAAVARCLNNLKEHEKGLSRLKKLKQEVAALERRY